MAREAGGKPRAILRTAPVEAVILSYALRVMFAWPFAWRAGFSDLARLSESAVQSLERVKL